MRSVLVVFAAIGLVTGATLGTSAPASAATVELVVASVSAGDYGHGPQPTPTPDPTAPPVTQPAPTAHPTHTPTPAPTATTPPDDNHGHGGDGDGHGHDGGDKDGSNHGDDHDGNSHDGNKDHGNDNSNCSKPSHPTPPPTLTTPVWSFDLGSIDVNDIHPGATLVISGTGLPAGTTLDTVLHSVPVDLGSELLGSSGPFSQSVVIPADTPLGAHELIVTATGPTITTTTVTKAITVTAAAALATLPEPASLHISVPAIAPPDAIGSGLAITGNAPATAVVPTTPPTKRFHAKAVTEFDANILTRALSPIVDVAQHPQKIVSALEIGLVLLIMAVLPAHLLSATIAEQSARFERRLARVRRRPQWMIRWAAWLKTRPVIGGVAITAATAVILGFADPTFGFTIASVRLILACAIGLLLVGYVANALAAWIARRQWQIIAEIRLRPYGLVLTIAGVLLSRILHFSPGFLVGLILGLTVQGVAAKGYAGRLVAVRACVVLGMGIAAWIGYSTLTIGGNEGGTFGSALLVETLVAITTEGIVALLVELLPLRFLEGERLYAHSKLLWGILYFATLVIFVLAVVSWEGNWDALGKSFWVWIALLVVFAAICVGVYVYFRRFAKPLDDEAGTEEVPLGEEVSSKR